jgi:N-acetyl-gamma-glutamyl-phosphate reductase
MITQYQVPGRAAEYQAPREYALSQQHKHLKEMQAITGLSRAPLFTPVVADYYSGMVVSVPLHREALAGGPSVSLVHRFFMDYYKGEKFIQVMPYGAESESNGFLSGITCSGLDGMKIFVTGNEDRILLTAQFDNLGKGASGAAVQCLNLLIGCEEDRGLNLKEGGGGYSIQ